MKTPVALITILITTLCLATEVPQSAADVRPLRVGDPVPEATLHTPEDSHVNLREKVTIQPTVIIFYRGGWCPYCNRHLSAVQTIEQQLVEMGYQILAVSPDRPEKLRETAEQNHVNYQLLSDSSMASARAFGIAFQLDDATVQKYKEQYKIDIEADSGQTHHQLPVPAVFIADTNGQIVFEHFNPDYKVRLTPEVLLVAAQSVLPKGNAND